VDGGNGEIEKASMDMYEGGERNLVEEGGGCTRGLGVLWGAAHHGTYRSGKWYSLSYALCMRTKHHQEGHPTALLRGSSSTSDRFKKMSCGRNMYILRYFFLT
jgi:hypothetical protein